MNEPKKEIIVVQCEGNCSDTMEIQRLEWGVDDLDYVIDFRISTFYCGQSPWGIIRERLQLAWLAIRKGNYIHQEIITNRAALCELRDRLTAMLVDKPVPPLNLTGNSAAPNVYRADIISATSSNSSLPASPKKPKRRKK